MLSLEQSLVSLATQTLVEEFGKMPTEGKIAVLLGAVLIGASLHSRYNRETVGHQSLSL